MANRYQSEDRWRRERAQRGYGRQAEQFESDYEDRFPRQMGEGWRDEEAQQSAWQSDERYDRNYREPQNERYENEQFGTAGYGPSRFTPGGGRSFTSFTGNDFGGADFVGRSGTYGPERGPIGSSRGYRGDSYGGGSWGAGRPGAGSWLGANRGEWRDPGHGRDRDDERGFFERAGDEVASWFGDEDAARRRAQDHRGRGPVGYKRTDERIREDASERLAEDWAVDARKIELSVNSGEITLDGTVTSRAQKRRAEDLIEDLSGVTHVQNNLRVDRTDTRDSAWDRNNSGEPTRGTGKST